MTVQSSRRVAALATVAVLTLSGAARADGPSDLEAALSEPVVTTASRGAEDQSTAPATITTITADDLRRYGIHSLDEAINYLSMGMITQNPLHSVDVGARGVLLTADFGDHVLLLVNGHAMNEQWDGTAYFERGAGIPMELIDHIECSLGPGSVLYGAQAMLGVINIITKRAKDYDGLHFIGETELGTSYRGAIGFGREFTLFGRPAEITYQLEYYSQSGPAFTFAPQTGIVDTATGKGKCFNPTCGNPGTWGGTVDNGYYTQIPSGYMRLLWDNFELDVRAESYKRATPYPNQFNITFGDFNDPNSYERDRWLSLDLKHRAALSSVAQLRSRMYGDTYDYLENVESHAAGDCLTGQTRGCIYHLLGFSRWVGLEEQLALDWLHDGSLTTLLGTDDRVRNVGSKTDETDIVTNQNPGSYGTYAYTEYALAFYAQQTWRPVRWLGLNAGARLDDDQRFGTRVSPRAAASLTTWKGGTFKAIYSEAFRTPTSYETNYADGLTEIAAPNLKPETVRSAEASIEHRFGTQRILFGAFGSWWSNMVLLQTLTRAELDMAIAQGMVPSGDTGVSQYQNVSSIDDYGFNGAFEGSALGRDLRYGVNLTGAVSRRSNPDGSVLPLTVAPQLFGNARISYDLPGDWPVVGVVGQVVGSRPADRAFDGGFAVTPYAPTQVELRATVSGPVPRVSGLSYRVSADCAFAGENPYVAGPIQYATSPTQTAQLSPVNRFVTTMGLQYDLR